MIISLLAAATVAAQPPGCLQYEPAEVHLRGRIVDKVHYGPPGYGEDPAHDRVEPYLLLKLDHPICVNGTPGDDLNSVSERSVTELMIVPPAGRRLPRGQVRAAGTLFHAFTAHHATPVLIELTAAERITPK